MFGFLIFFFHMPYFVAISHIRIFASTPCDDDQYFSIIQKKKRKVLNIVEYDQAKRIYCLRFRVADVYKDNELANNAHMT